MAYKKNKQTKADKYSKKNNAKGKITEGRTDGQKAEWTDGHLYKLPVFIAPSSFVVEKTL